MHLTFYSLKYTFYFSATQAYFSLTPCSWTLTPYSLPKEDTHSSAIRSILQFDTLHSVRLMHAPRGNGIVFWRHSRIPERAWCFLTFWQSCSPAMSWKHRCGGVASSVFWLTHTHTHTDLECFTTADWQFGCASSSVFVSCFHRLELLKHHCISREDASWVITSST